MQPLLCLSCPFLEQIDKSKYVGLWRGLKETLGFKPFFYLLMLDFLTWMGFQVRELNVIATNCMTPVLSPLSCSSYRQMLLCT